MSESAVRGLNRTGKSSLLAAGILASSAASANDDLLITARQIFNPIPSMAPAVKDNPITEEKVILGKTLFFDPRLSASQVISCNTCHNLGTGGVDAGPTSVGHRWQLGSRRAPTVYNAVFNVAQFWDGRAADLKAQASGPVQASIEMNATPARVLDTLNSMTGYVVMFGKAFPKDARPITFDNFAKAIEAFEATLITPGAPFDRYLKGDAYALSDQQKSGLKLFIDKGCASCHSGMNVGGQDYFPFGVVERPAASLLPSDDKGRFAVTKAPGDEYVFRSAPLRNVALRPPYFHSGQVWDLKQAVGVMSEVQLGVKLDDREKDDIVAFLNSLTGQLPKIDYPILPTRTDKTPKPSVDK
ncbi:cytochrome-c peroxidase [Bradyrhizobium sacchari]|uniref:Cytochrome c peroxidase n=1 Tax=Bradyrhizobium sacchari TaxID=1399419 RepID=A0A560HQC4_9BRAD|nr:cytochrome-c peroxidase [Bradyrhizobium sacchari]TWB48768.1 cytochrome c peroxidase [Bradyrhizobium sacchari]TWB67929.1 cytochrome c peroxidase [Bradyrhizobium sacchari]